MEPHRRVLEEVGELRLALAEGVLGAAPLAHLAFERVVRARQLLRALGDALLEMAVRRPELLLGAAPLDQPAEEQRQRHQGSC